MRNPIDYITNKLDSYIHRNYKDQKIARTAEEWIDYKEFGKKEHPYLYKVYKCLYDFEIWLSVRYRRYVEDPYYHLKNRLVRKSHLIDTGLKRGQWYDTDTRILHGMMEELVRFIEIEKDGYPWELKELEKKRKGEPNEIDGEPDNEYDGMNESQWRDMKTAWEVYTWWKKYPERRKMVDDMLDHTLRDKSKENDIMTFMADKTYKKHNDIVRQNRLDAEEKLTKEESIMLKKIIDIRGSLWT